MRRKNGGAVSGDVPGVSGRALTPQQVQMLGVGQRMTYAAARRDDPQRSWQALYRVPKVAVIDYLCSAAALEKASAQGNITRTPRERKDFD